VSTNKIPQQQQRQRQQQQQHLIIIQSRVYRALVSHARCKSGDTAAIRPEGDTNDFNSSAKKDRQTSIKVTIEGPHCQQVIMRPSENATRLLLESFDGAKTGHESAVFERPTDLNA
jgi:hypothetical protein